MRNNILKLEKFFSIVAYLSAVWLHLEKIQCNSPTSAFTTELRDKQKLKNIPVKKKHYFIYQFIWKFNIVPIG